MKRNTREDIKANFERNTANHNMEVLMDNGLYRHLKFTNNGSSVYRFDLITWPGYLAVAGDMGEWVFRRIPDMFDFFIMDENDWNHKHVINPGYWGEKLQAACKNNIGGHTTNGYEEFSQEVFKENVKHEYEQWIRDNEIDSESNYAQGLWQALEEEVIYAANDGPHPAYEAARDFSFDDDDWRLEDNPYKVGKFDLGDFWEYNCTEFNYHYIWICYAIVYGITQYKKIQNEQTAA